MRCPKTVLSLVLVLMVAIADRAHCQEKPKVNYDQEEAEPKVTYDEEGEGPKVSYDEGGERPKINYDNNLNASEDRPCDLVDDIVCGAYCAGQKPRKRATCDDGKCSCV
ncbi:hypothetical protein TKK_0010792 [Trichogramma kaykai]